MMLEILTPKEVAEQLKIPISTIVELCRRKKFKGASKVGRQWRIPVAAVAGYFK